RPQVRPHFPRGVLWAAGGLCWCGPRRPSIRFGPAIGGETSSADGRTEETRHAAEATQRNRCQSHESRNRTNRRAPEKVEGATQRVAEGGHGKPKQRFIDGTAGAAGSPDQTKRAQSRNRHIGGNPREQGACVA